MPRLTSLPIESFDPELRALLAADQKSERELRPFSIRAHHPELAKAHAVYGAALKKHSVLTARLRELVRIRIAFHNQCRSCMAMRYRSGLDDGMTEGDVCSLERPEEAPDLTPAEKSALAYADVSALNHFAIDDGVFEGLRLHFTEAEIVELGLYIAYFTGFGRLVAAWDISEELPGAAGDRSAMAAPWAVETFVVTNS